MPIICEAIAGDTAIGHNLCLCQALESLAGMEVDPGASITRCVALELERLANHIGDLGALSGDVAFNPPASYFGRIRGNFSTCSRSCAVTVSVKGWFGPAGWLMPWAKNSVNCSERNWLRSPRRSSMCVIFYSLLIQYSPGLNILEPFPKKWRRI